MPNPLSLDPWYSPLTDEWMRKKMAHVSNLYMSGEIRPSPYLQRLIYGETLDLNHPRLTDCVLNHLRIIWGPAGGINTNDYRHLPMEFRKRLYPMLQSYSTDSTVENADKIRLQLKKDYGLEGPLAEMMIWFHTAGPQHSGILKRDSTEVTG